LITLPIGTAGLEVMSERKGGITNYILPVGFAVVIIYTFEVAGPKWGWTGIFIGICVISIIRVYMGRAMIAQSIDTLQVAMFGRPGKSEYWDDKKEYNTARKKFLKTILMGLYWKFIGKHIQKVRKKWA